MSGIVPALKISEIAERLGAACEGDGTRVITGIAGIRDAGGGDITFLANRRYTADAVRTQAAAILVPKDWDQSTEAVVLRVDDPDSAFAEVARWFAPPAYEPPPGIHPSAVIADDVVLGLDVRIGAQCVVESGVEIGDRSILFPCCYVGPGTRIGVEARIYPQVSIREHARIGDRVIIHNGAVIGSDGFGYTVDKKGVRTKIPQIGIVEIGNDVEIGACVAIDRARFGKTVIGNGVKIDNLVQIAHNVVIGDHAVIVSQVGISGSTRVGKHAIMAGQSGVAGHVVIGDGAVVAARGGVTKDVPAGAFYSDYPAMPHNEARKKHAYIARLPKMKEQIAELEKRVKQLEEDRTS